MKLHLMEKREPYGYTTWGCIWKQGEVSLQDDFCVWSARAEVPSQSRIMAYWPDHSVKWTAHTADSKQLGEQIEVAPVRKSGQAGGGGSKGITVTETQECFWADAGGLQVRVPRGGSHILEQLSADGCLQLEKAELVLQLEERPQEGVTRVVSYTGVIREVRLEEAGPLQATFVLRGVHQSRMPSKDGSAREVFPFVLRETIHYNSRKIDFVHTFMFDGDEQRDFMKGLGIRFVRPMSGALYNRHVRFLTDHGSFCEALVLLNSWHPRVPADIYRRQLEGELLELDLQADKEVLEAAGNMPVWSRYLLCQDSAGHFSIRKKIKNPRCCYIEALHGRRAPGGAAFGDENGGLCIAAKDFWQKYPSGIELGNLDTDRAEAVLWLWCPQAEAMDFRHYADQGYSQTYYEGFDEVGAAAYGIANTGSFSVECFTGQLPGGEELGRLSGAVQRPPLYIGEPEYYHQLRAFGQWSLPLRSTPAECFLEDQLDRAFSFYQKEIEVRSWYGMFNYGDIMHTYDRFRHSWRYDMGGYAWQNTELVPTFWLWLAFLRSGREDIFVMAEAMSRHCSEVDIYHFGPLKGLGSRHNVRHWGCSCKEARIAMAGHHRFYYYLTGDLRMGDILEEVKEADQSAANMDPLRYFYDKDQMVYPTHARSGPDWSSFCSNWMTQWERFDDSACRDKIVVGIEDLKRFPLRLISGPDFEYDPGTGHLRYIGERMTGGSHLQLCMGAVQVWTELGGLLGDEQWLQMLAELGSFYYQPRQKQLELSGGLIGDRQFTLPFMASGLAAFAAARLKDEELAKTTWRILLHALCKEDRMEGFAAETVKNAGNQEELEEIFWISTNFTAQWCLNIITALEYIRESLPETTQEIRGLLAELDEEGYHKA